MSNPLKAYAAGDVEEVSPSTKKQQSDGAKHDGAASPVRSADGAHDVGRSGRSGRRRGEAAVAREEQDVLAGNRMRGRREGCPRILPGASRKISVSSQCGRPPPGGQRHASPGPVFYDRFIVSPPRRRAIALQHIACRDAPPESRRGLRASKRAVADSRLGTSGTTIRGASSQVVYTSMNASIAASTATAEIEVIAAEPPNTFVERNVSAGGRRIATETYRLEPLPSGGTRITFEYAWQQAPLGDRVAAPLVRAILTRGNPRAMARLAEQLASREAAAIGYRGRPVPRTARTW